MMKLTAAHLKLPFNTKVLVEDPRTGNTVVVRVNDRGPFHAKRVMDLSKGGATKLGTISRGVTYVDCMILDDDSKKLIPTNAHQVSISTTSASEMGGRKLLRID